VGAVHSQARVMVTKGYTATLVAATLAISRSGLYYQKWPRGSRADRTSWRAETSWRMAISEWRGGLQRQGLPVNRKRVLRVMRERGLLVRSRRLRARRKKEWGRVEASRAESNLAVEHDENLGGSYSGLGVPGVRDRLLRAGVANVLKHEALTV
jgi:hypothetical protein